MITSSKTALRQVIASDQIQKRVRELARQYLD